MLTSVVSLLQLSRGRDAPWLLLEQGGIEIDDIDTRAVITTSLTQFTPLDVPNIYVVIGCDIFKGLVGSNNAVKHGPTNIFSIGIESNAISDWDQMRHRVPN